MAYGRSSLSHLLKESLEFPDDGPLLRKSLLEQAQKEHDERMEAKKIQSDYSDA